MPRPGLGLRRWLPLTLALLTLAACRSPADEPVDGAAADGWGICDELAVTARWEACRASRRQAAGEAETPQAGCFCVLDQKGRAAALRAD